jgi:hypothetical protein
VKPNRVYACIIAVSVLSAASACVMGPMGGGGGGHQDERADHGSGEHLNNLRDADHWNDAGDHSEREQSDLNAKRLRLAKAQLLWHAIYYPAYRAKNSPGFWA